MTYFASVLIAASVIALAGCSRRPGATEAARTQHKEKTMITLQQMEDMFANMRTKTKWDIDGDMLWGYFFTDRDPKKLERAAEPLVRGGYRLVSIYQTDDKSTYFLHVERIEKHTPQTLQSRNLELYRLAEEFALDSYDGMDVGPVAK